VVRGAAVAGWERITLALAAGAAGIRVLPRGTCWLVTGPEPIADEDPRWEMTRRQPSVVEAGALRVLVSGLLGRPA
jgi:hypothetical protein